MAGAGFLLTMVAGVALSCVSYGLVARIISKRQVSTLRAVSWGIIGTLSLVLGVCAFSAVSAEHSAEKQGAVCVGNAPECYAKAHHNPVKKCKQVMDRFLTSWFLLTTQSKWLCSNRNVKISLAQQNNFIRILLI